MKNSNNNFFTRKLELLRGNNYEVVFFNCSLKRKDKKVLRINKRTIVKREPIVKNIKQDISISLRIIIV